MKKSLAESIREALDVIAEASNLEYALLDLHNESGGNPTKELADEIAADYAGVTADKLLAAYPAWVEKEANKNTTPVVDPEKEAQKKKWATMKSHRDWEERIAAKRG